MLQQDSRALDPKLQVCGVVSEILMLLEAIQMTCLVMHDIGGWKIKCLRFSANIRIGSRKELR